MNEKTNEIVDDKSSGNSDQNLDEKPEKNQVVDFKTYDRSMKTVGKLREVEKELRSELETYKAKEREEEEARLEAEGNFKERLELERRKREEVEEKYNGLSERHYGALKEVALRRSLPKLIEDEDVDAILRSKANKVLIDDDGLPIKDSVEEIANELKSKNWMFASAIKRNLPADAPKENASKLTYEAWLELPKSERNARFQEMRQNDIKR